MKMSSRLFVLVGLLALSVAANAADYVVLDQRADEFDRWQDRVDWSYGRPVVSQEFGVPATVLDEQRDRTHLGYGGLMIANALATETGRSFDEIVAMKTNGYGWGRIARENGVKFGPIVSRMNRADASFRKVKTKSNRGHAKGKDEHGKSDNDHCKGKDHGSKDKKK